MHGRRKRTGQKRKSQYIISVYFEKPLHLQIKRKCEANDISVSRYLRILARRDLEKAA